MPVPLSVTNPKGAGLAAAVAAELQTEGPFARLAHAVQPNAKNGSEAAAAVQPAAAGAAQPSGSSGGGAGGSLADAAVATHGLNFSYPDIGEMS
jgi:hypothetical protein